jgi:hypothetical protein
MRKVTFDFHAGKKYDYGFLTSVLQLDQGGALVPSDHGELFWYFLMTMMSYKILTACLSSSF